MDNQELAKLRNNKVVKSNTLIQQSRHQFSVQQQKALLFLISQLKPDQKKFEWQIFDITEFCEVCGIEAAGDNYKDVKNALQGLSDKSLWMTLEDGTENLSRWLQNVQIQPKSGKVRVRFDEYMKPFLLELKARFTAFDLRYTLAMRSKYSVRLYELLKSYSGMSEKGIEFDLQRFKKLVGAEYTLWYDLKRKVLDISVREINEVSDLFVKYEGIKKGRSFIGVRFFITHKTDWTSKMDTERELYKRFEKA